jgi:hypothetical protein
VPAHAAEAPAKRGGIMQDSTTSRMAGFRGSWAAGATCVMALVYVAGLGGSPGPHHCSARTHTTEHHSTLNYYSSVVSVHLTKYLEGR